MIENKLDVTELPVAESVKDGDQLLLVRTQKNGVKVPMRMEPQKLTKQKKQKKQQIVIGRAIRPRACEIGGVENWYVFGRVSWNPTPLLLNIASMLPCASDSPDLGYDMVVLNITNQKTGKVYVFKDSVYYCNSKKFYKTFIANEDTAQTTGWVDFFLKKAVVANAFRVDSYDMTARVLTLNLTHKFLPTADLRGTSTHHYFKYGVRRWHVRKSNIALRAFYTGSWFGHCTQTFNSSDIVVNQKYILLKKEEKVSPHVIKGSTTGYRGQGCVVSYRKVKYKEDVPSCQLNYSISKRRPYGKYMIWSLHRMFPRRKSDEYLHCRIKCVGLGKFKDAVPGYDMYRVTVREI